MPSFKCAIWQQLSTMAMILVSTGANAQAPQPDPLHPVCPAGMSPRTDTTNVIVALEPARAFLDAPFTDAQRTQISFYADAIARRFVPPQSLGALPTLVDMPAYYQDGRDNGSRSALSGRLVLVVKRTGRIRTLAWEYYPIATALGKAIVQAAQDADSAGDFDGIMRPVDKKSDDTLAIDIRSRMADNVEQFPLMRARLAGYRAETLAMVQKAGRLEYPRTAALANVGTTGEVRFVVGTDGRAVMALAQVTRAGWRDFVQPMWKAIATSEFIPATSGGCKVPAWVRQQFAFQGRD